MIKAVFFDFYRTLCVWGEPFQPRLQRIVDRYGVEVNWTHYAAAREELDSNAFDIDPAILNILGTIQHMVDSYRDFLKTLGVHDYLDQIAWEMLQSEHSIFAASAATLYDDVIPTLQCLRNDGFKLAIVSNWGVPLDPLTERLGIAEYFDVIVASHDARVRSVKPDPHIFNYTLEAMSVSAEEVVHVGDTYEADIIGAKNARIRPILIDRDGTQTGRWHETIRNLSELPALLSGRVCGV